MVNRSYYLPLWKGLIAVVVNRPYYLQLWKGLIAVMVNRPYYLPLWKGLIAIMVNIPYYIPLWKGLITVMVKCVHFEWWKNSMVKGPCQLSWWHCEILVLVKGYHIVTESKNYHGDYWMIIGQLLGYIISVIYTSEYGMILMHHQYSDTSTHAQYHTCETWTPLLYC